MTFLGLLALDHWTWYDGMITAIALGATLRAGQVLRETSHDENELNRRHLNGDLLDLVQGSKRVEWIRLGVKLSFVAYGFWAGFTVPSDLSRGVAVGILTVGLVFMYLQGEVSIRIKRDQLRHHGVEPHADRVKHDDGRG